MMTDCRSNCIKGWSVYGNASQRKGLFERFHHYGSWSDYFYFGLCAFKICSFTFVLDITGRAIFCRAFAISSLPILLTPFGGAIAHRLNRRNLMVLFDFVSSGIVWMFLLDY